MVVQAKPPIRYFNSKTKISFVRFAGLLRVSTKYDSKRVRQTLAQLLEKAYPATRYQFQLRPIAEESLFSKPLPHPNAVAMLLQQCNMNKYLPSAMYIACTSGMDSLLSDKKGNCLPPDTLRKAIRATIWLKSNELERLRAVFAEHSQSCECKSSSRELVALQDENFLLGLDMRMSTPPSFFDLRRKGHHCSACVNHWQTKHIAEENTVWDALPALVGLGTWKEILAEDSCA